MVEGLQTIEHYLVQQGTISPEMLDKARERQREGKSLGEVLQEMGAVDSRTWARSLADYYGLPFRELLPEENNIPELIKELPINFAKQYRLVPLGRTDEAVVLVASADPLAAAMASSTSCRVACEMCASTMSSSIGEPSITMRSLRSRE